MKLINITAPPADYNGWVECLEALEDGIPDDNAEHMLSVGTCPEYSGIKPYFHLRIENSVNAIINTCIKELRREVSRLTAEGDVRGLHIAFIRFSKRIRRCLFFNRIPFLDSGYKEELLIKTQDAVNAFWSDTLSSLQNDVRHSDSNALEEELYLIKRIRLFN